MKRFGAVLGVLVLLSASLAWAGGASSTRPGHGGGHGGGGGSGPTHAQGHATYGHYPSHGGHGGYWHGGGWYGGYWGYPYYGYGWYGGYWGWPNYGWYGYPAYGYYGYPGYVTVLGEGGGGGGGGPAVVLTDVTPGKAAVMLDGEPIGKAKDFNGVWDVLRIEPGEHVLEFTRDGYKTLQVHIDARSGRTYAVHQALEQGEGVDTRSMKEAPPPPYSDAKETRTEIAEDGAPATGRVARGLLRVEVTPGDAAIYLDGEFLGRADELTALRGAIPVAEGTHRLEAVRPGRRSEQREVTVGGREPVRVAFEMERDQ